MKQCEQYRVKGRVQGVFFRASTRDQAQRLGLRGYVRNLPGGDVEVVAWGEREDLHKLAAWLWKGPPSARVTDVASEPLQGHDEFEDFVVR